MEEKLLKKLKHIKKNLLYYERVYPNDIKKIDEYKKELEKCQKQLSSKK